MRTDQIDKGYGYREGGIVKPVSGSGQGATLMARTPRTTVSSTSGQGTGRYSYQHAYELGMKGTGAPGKNALRMDASLATKRRYSKTKPVNVDTKWNISYGDTWGKTWDEIKHKDKNKPPRGPRI